MLSQLSYPAVEASAGVEPTSLRLCLAPVDPAVDDPSTSRSVRLRRARWLPLPLGYTGGRWPRPTLEGRGHRFLPLAKGGWFRPGAIRVKPCRWEELNLHCDRRAVGVCVCVVVCAT